MRFLIDDGKSEILTTGHFRPPCLYKNLKFNVNGINAERINIRLNHIKAENELPYSLKIRYRFN